MLSSLFIYLCIYLLLVVCSLCAFPACSFSPRNWIYKIFRKEGALFLLVKSFTLLGLSTISGLLLVPPRTLTMR